MRLSPVEAWKQYVYNPVVNYLYMVYFFGSGKSWLDDEEKYRPTSPQE